MRNVSAKGQGDIAFQRKRIIRSSKHKTTKNKGEWNGDHQSGQDIKTKRKEKNHSSSLTEGTKALSTLQGQDFKKARLCMFVCTGGCTCSQLCRAPPSPGCILSEAQLQHLLPMLKSNLLHLGSHLQGPARGDSMGRWTILWERALEAPKKTSGNNKSKQLLDT